MPCCNTSKYKRLQRVLCRSCKLYRPRRKTAHRALQGRFRQFDPFHRIRYKTDTSGYNTTCATLERITAPQHFQRIPDTTATPDAVQVSTAAYYNKVYKSAAHRKLCQPGGVSMLPTPSGLQSGTGQQSGHTGSVWHPTPGWAVQQQSAAGGAEPLAALAASLFGLSPDS